ncbi:DUF1289 domain-containing protein [Paucibacter sp. O1-1]|uniref:DUF1289 domain-containing protein n=1 Tax=Roseateles TaxID=93681 RepID=UPI0010F92085|nr:DUF1289 domain-containing protein [Paucibacter sp. M5-1]MCU7372610.1 DUF1289 domain-containing protein [Paucibacter sp. O1-1]MCZ7882848.1 DUF1289 domain-containing protein [Paucibacter sp. M5-1]MDA3827604.1 DUF1289 domain-containing protein [Paucibacter sp. O1-1]
MNAVLVSSVPSPCSNVCKMHEASGWCEGCARTIAEIAAWSRADDATRLAILARLPERRAALIEQGIFTAAASTDGP